MGYGFVEYSSLKLMNEALKQLQNSELQGHRLELKRSDQKNEINSTNKINYPKSFTTCIPESLLQTFQNDQRQSSYSYEKAFTQHP